MSHFYFIDESDYSEENKCENKVFGSTIIEKKPKHIHASAADILHTVLEWDISIGADARSSCWRSSVKKGVLKNFSKFTGKHLCQSLFFNKAADLNFFYRTTPDDCF